MAFLYEKFSLQSFFSIMVVLAGNPYSVQICVGVLRHVVVEDNVDPFDVHASSKEIRSHQDSLAEALKCLVLGKSEQKKTNI